MAIEAIGMQVHGVVALVAELSLVLMALAAAAQSNLVANSLAYSFVPEFPQEDPMVLAHPGGVANAALRRSRRNFQKRPRRGEYRAPREAPNAIREWRENNDTGDYG